MLITPPRTYKLGAIFCCTLSVLGLPFLFSYVHEENCDSIDVSNETELVKFRSYDIKIISSGRNICKNDTKYVVVVHSAYKNSQLREAIRETWGNQSSRDIPVAFMLGVAANDTEASLVYEEVNKYGDIVLGDFVDSYHNLTWKHLMALKWSIEYCASVKFVMKFDDDVIVQLERLVSYLEGNEHNSNIICDSVEKAVVQRRKISKWCVPYVLYKNDTYPTYCNGYGIIYPVEAVRPLLNSATTTEYFWIDDVFVTGILAQKAGIRIVRENLFISPQDYLSKVMARWQHSGKARRVFRKKMIGPSEVHDAFELRRLWKLMPS